MSSKKICILIPAFNEERTISEVISKIPKIPNHLTTILVVDDGSQDNTKKIAEKMGAVVISNRKNAGLGYTFKRGLRYAIKMGADIIVILDADGQYDPVEIKRFVKVLYENKGDIIVGNRILSSSVINYGIMRKWMNFLISFFISKILLKNKFIFDTQTSFRVFNKRVAQFLLSKLKGTYNYAQELLILTYLKGFKILQLPVSCYYYRHRKSRLIQNIPLHVIKVVMKSLQTYIKGKFSLTD